MKIYRILAEVAVPNCVKREDVEREVEQTLGRETDWVNCAEILEVKRVDVTLQKVAKTAKGSEVRGRMGEGGGEMNRLLYHEFGRERR